VKAQNLTISPISISKGEKVFVLPSNAIDEVPEDLTIDFLYAACFLADRNAIRLYYNDTSEFKCINNSDKCKCQKNGVIIFGSKTLPDISNDIVQPDDNNASTDEDSVRQESNSTEQKASKKRNRK
jgi:hypothetical protein